MHVFVFIVCVLTFVCGFVCVRFCVHRTCVSVLTLCVDLCVCTFLCSSCVCVLTLCVDLCVYVFVFIVCACVLVLVFIVCVCSDESWLRQACGVGQHVCCWSIVTDKRVHARPDTSLLSRPANV